MEMLRPHPRCGELETLWVKPWSLYFKKKFLDNAGTASLQTNEWGRGPEAQEVEMTCLGLHGEVFREPGLEL